MGAHNNSENFKITRKEENNIENEESVAESFSNAIHSGGKHIAMNEDVLLTETLEIDVDDIVLDGQGHTIQGGAKNTPILLITSNKVTLKNITFKKADSNTDGAAINNLNSDAQIINCEFIGNKAPESNGGAIYNHYGKLNIKNCNFKDNRSETKDGGAIFNFDGEVTIDECNFEKNYAKFGGAIYNGKSLNLKNTHFLNNSSNSGPALFNTFDSVTTIENCTFKRDEMHSLQNNFEIHNRGTVNIDKSQKEKIEDIIQGGFIHISSKNAKSFKYLNEKINSGLKTIKLDHDIINKEFKNGIDLNNDDLIIDGNNFTIDGLGKGIFNVNGKNITLKNINFRNGSSIEGGAINNKSESLTLTDCNFDCNISNTGGAINNYGTIDAENCNFRKNIANGNNGGAINNTGDIKLTKCNFLNNYSDENGGAINNSNKLNTYDCCFISNHAKNGASINNIKPASLNLINTKFLQNKAVEQGSILYNENSVYMKDCKSLNNISSSEYSNIIYQKGDENTCLDIQNCEFSREKYNNNLIFVENGSCDIHSTKFNLKKEHENSYAIYNENAILKVKDLAFENIDNEIIFNNNIIHIENDDDIESLIKPGEESLPFKYNSNQ